MAAAAAAISRSAVLCRSRLRESISPFPAGGRRRRQPHRLLAARPLHTALESSPPPPLSNVVDILRERGLVESITGEDELRAACAAGSVGVYCGFDPTAESLHLGNLLGLVVLAWFRRCGHRPVALVGGATARVGDPSGKSLERPELDPAAIARNSAAISATISRVLGGAVDLVDNYDWWCDMTLLDFLRRVGRYARVGAMIGKESVKKRLSSEEGLSFTEFSYQLLQGYDFLHLFKAHGVSVQVGGSDQWGNITAGTELIRKVAKPAAAHGLTFPLLLKSDGSKFGKSESGAVWLSPEKLSPYKLYQHLFAVPDADVVRFLKMLTFVPMAEIEAVERAMAGEGEGYEANAAQRRLAEEVTRMVHGEEGVREAERVTAALRPGAAAELDAAAMEAVAEGLPVCELSAEAVVGAPLAEVAVAAGLMASKSAARRVLRQGGMYLNNARVESEERVVGPADVVDGKMLLISAGKKNKMVVRISSSSS
ncbi:tyrosyl-tRNA synthetase, class Ib, bacterial/mitochondrial [Wolffia australiana]